MNTRLKKITALAKIKKIPQVAFAEFAKASKSRKIIFISGVILLIGLAIGAGGYNRGQAPSSKAVDVKALIDKYTQQEDCEVGLKNLDPITLDRSDLQYTKLLEYRSSCQEKLGRYAQAIESLKALEAYYKEIENTPDVINVQGRIKTVYENEERAKNPLPAAKPTQKDGAGNEILL